MSSVEELRNYDILSQDSFFRGRDWNRVSTEQSHVTVVAHDRMLLRSSAVNWVNRFQCYQSKRDNNQKLRDRRFLRFQAAWTLEIKASNSSRGMDMRPRLCCAVLCM
jgi:hypothetical protein